MKYLELDKKFHILLNQSCNNKKSIKILDDIQELEHWLRNYSLERILFKGSIKKYLNIIEVLKNKNEKLVIKTLL